MKGGSNWPPQEELPAKSPALFDLSTLLLRSSFTRKINLVPCELQFFRNIWYLIFALNIFRTDSIFFWLNQNLKDKLLGHFDFLFFEIEKDALWWSSKILSLPLKVFCYKFVVNLEVDPVGEVSLFDTFFYSAFFIKFANTSTNKIVS